MNTILDKEKMLYDALASKTSDKDFIISFHDYFSFILSELSNLCVHLYAPMIEHGEEVERLEKVYKEMTEGVANALNEIELFLKA